MSAADSAKPVALVIGATGAQGGSVARALLPEYHVRTLSRTPEKDNAKAIAAEGVEVIKGDLTDAAAVAAALKDAKVVFLVTQFWESLSKEKELEDAKPFIDAVAASGAKLVFSALENVTKLSGGKFTKVAHFDGKGLIADYIRSKSVPAVFVALAMYADNFTGFFKPSATADGKLAITLPDATEKAGANPCNFVGVSDLGPAVAAILRDWSAWEGKWVPIVGWTSTLGDFVKLAAEVTGKPLVFNGVPAAVFASFGFPGAADIAEMFEAYAEPGLLDRDPKTLLALNPSAKQARTWLEANKETLVKAWGV